MATGSGLGTRLDSQRTVVRMKEKCEEVIKHSLTVDNAAMLFEAATKYKAQVGLGATYAACM